MLSVGPAPREERLGASPMKRRGQVSARRPISCLFERRDGFYRRPCGRYRFRRRVPVANRGQRQCGHRFVLAGHAQRIAAISLNTAQATRFAYGHKNPWKIFRDASPRIGSRPATQWGKYTTATPCLAGPCPSVSRRPTVCCSSTVGAAMCDKDPETDLLWRSAFAA
jgi:hypothetical protein